MFYETRLSDDGLPFSIIIQKLDAKESHWHNYLEFLLVLDGLVEVRVRNKKYSLKKDDLFVINNKEIHSIAQTKEENLVLRLKIDLCHYSKYYPYMKDMMLRNDYFLKEENRNRSTLYKKTMAKILKESYREKEGYKLRMASQVDLLLSYIIEKYASMNDLEYNIKNEDTKFIDIKEIMDFIDNNFHEGINRDDIAGEFYFNKHHLSRFFKSMTGITMQDYFNYVRLVKATEELKQTNHSITIIAGDCGLDSPRALNRLFNKYYDTTPSEYRKQYEEAYHETTDQKSKNGRNGQMDLQEAIDIMFKYLDD